MSRFHDLNYEKFRQLATDPRLSKYEKIGFPNSYREGYEERIFADILGKLPRLGQARQLVLDIGPGVSDLPHMLIDHCRAKEHTLFLVDSPEMLAQLPDAPFLHKVIGLFPRDCPSLLQQCQSKVNVLLAYSVLHYAMVDTNLFDFVDGALSLLASGGQLLIGDVPNVSKRKRFFASAAGIAYHRSFTGNSEDVPTVEFNRLEAGRIDDGVLVGLIVRCRLAGCDAYLLPQAEDLPMANRREDILIIKP